MSSFFFFGLKNVFLLISKWYIISLLNIWPSAIGKQELVPSYTSHIFQSENNIFRLTLKLYWYCLNTADNQNLWAVFLIWQLSPSGESYTLNYLIFYFFCICHRWEFWTEWDRKQSPMSYRKILLQLDRILLINKLWLICSISTSLCNQLSLYFPIMSIWSMWEALFPTWLNIHRHCRIPPVCHLGYHHMGKEFRQACLRMWVARNPYGYLKKINIFFLKPSGTAYLLICSRILKNHIKKKGLSTVLECSLLVGASPHTWQHSLT